MNRPCRSLTGYLSNRWKDTVFKLRPSLLTCFKTVWSKIELEILFGYEIRAFHREIDILPTIQTLLRITRKPSKILKSDFCI